MSEKQKYSREAFIKGGIKAAVVSPFYIKDRLLFSSERTNTPLAGSELIKFDALDDYSKSFFQSVPPKDKYISHGNEVLSEIKKKWPDVIIIPDSSNTSGTYFVAHEAIYTALTYFASQGVKDFTNHSYPGDVGKLRVVINDRSQMLDNKQIFPRGCSYVQRRDDTIQEVLYVPNFTDFSAYSLNDVNKMRAFLVGRDVHEKTHALQSTEIPYGQSFNFAPNSPFVESMNTVGYHVAPSDTGKIGLVDLTNLQYTFDGDEAPPDDYGLTTHSLLVEEQAQIMSYFFTDASFSYHKPKHFQYAQDALRQLSLSQNK